MKYVNTFFFLTWYLIVYTQEMLNINGQTPAFPAVACNVFPVVAARDSFRNWI